jgi:glycine/D-amino acid oxidase-like deaminating enzyme/nitrite reductase/ring-hydroxylating ferredoxin subunit
MKRDGSNKSLWQEVPDYISKEHQHPDVTYDVVIVGGGMTGVVTALLLQKAGKKCLLAEAHSLGFGTTGGTTAHLNTLLDTPYTTITSNFGSEASQTVARAASEAIDLIEKHVNLYNIQCHFTRTEAYLFSQEKKESEELENIYQASLQAGLSLKYVRNIPITSHFEKALQIEGQGMFHPTKYLLALAKEFERLGGNIQTNCKVENVKEIEDGILVETSTAVFKANKIIYATHIPPGINLLHLRCAPWRSYAIAVKLSHGVYPKGLTYDMKDPYHYYRTQYVDGKPYLIIGGNDHKTGEDVNTELVFRHLQAFAKSIFDIQEVTHQWSSQYFESSDGLPYIGHLPGHSDLYYVATGFGGNGMIYSHVAAMEITNMILSNESLYAEVFSPSRVKPIAGFKNFIEHNADVVKNFINKLIPADTLELVELAPGEGKIVDFEGNKIALSKDTDGRLHAVSSVCTHMKGTVAWNSTEKSWDCSCHGARYDVEGKVLTGPANQNLETVVLSDLIAES